MIDLFVIGHPRCATTTLYNLLKQSPDISVSTPKEIRYFDNHYERPVSSYDNHFDPNRICVDFNPVHSYVNFAAERIKMYNPNAKILQIVRDPYDRALSLWRLHHNMRAGREPRDFLQLLLDESNSFDPNRFEHEKNYLPFLDSHGFPYDHSVLESGTYGATRQRFQGLFTDVHTIRFEDITERPHDTVNNILSWIGADKMQELDYSEYNTDDHWDWKNKRSVAVDPIGQDELRSRRIVENVFRNDLNTLERLTGIAL